MSRGSSAGATPVLFIHGAWHGPWMWDEWLRLFRERGYLPRAITLRGHGPGERGYRKVGLREFHEDVEQAIGRLDRAPVLVGHSLGGLIIQHLLGGRGFPAAVLFAPIPGRYPSRIIGRNALRHPLVVASASLQNDLKPLVGTPKRVREILFTKDTPEDVVARCHAKLTGAWPGLFRQMVASEPPEPVAGTPTLLLAPENDSSFTVGMQRQLASKLGAELREIAGSGHDLPLDTPWQQAARLTLDWLAVHVPVAHGNVTGMTLRQE
jgi:pimeloyl-ACP methyl ester carboxylesterase